MRCEVRTARRATFFWGGRRWALDCGNGGAFAAKDRGCCLKVGFSQAEFWGRTEGDGSSESWGEHGLA